MASNFRGGISLEASSAKELRRKLKDLEKAVRKEIVDTALKRAGEIIRDEANAKAPGPHVIYEVMGGRKIIDQVLNRWSGMLGKITQNVRYVVIGPDDDHWFYRFFEFGATKHDISVFKSGFVAFQKAGQNIVAAFALLSGGVKKKPFLRPAMDSKGQSAVDEMGNYIRKEIERYAK